jgi:S1-C subfamily serine protease
MGQGGDPTPVTGSKTTVSAVPAELIEAALADAAHRSTVARADITVLSAEAVTWADGSLGCPQPGMMYTQALVPGYRIVLQAGDQTLNYHAMSRGKPVFCPMGRVQAPVARAEDPAV